MWLKHCDKPRLFSITSASHAVPLSDGLRSLLCDVNAVAMEPLIAVITAAVSGRSKQIQSYMSISPSICSNVSNWNNSAGAVNVHHEAVDVWFPTDAVQGCILSLHAAGLGPWYRVNVRHLTVLKGNTNITNHSTTNGITLNTLTAELQDEQKILC